MSQAYSNTRLIPPFDSSATSFDWRTWNLVSPVQNQGSCGSCYAFATTIAAETSWGIKTGLLYRISEQQIVDCDLGSSGCDGGSISNPFVLMSYFGAILYSDYPYVMR